MESLEGYRVEVNNPSHGELWQADICFAEDSEHGPWTLANMKEFAGDDVPTSLWFEKGWPELIIDILLGVAAATGPLVLIPDTGEAPVVVTADAYRQAIIENWEHTDETIDA